MKEVSPIIDKWTWKMKFCASRHIPPAQTWAWDVAEREYCLAHDDESIKLDLIDTNANL